MDMYRHTTFNTVTAKIVTHLNLCTSSLQSLEDLLMFVYDRTRHYVQVNRSNHDNVHGNVTLVPNKVNADHVLPSWR
jgi:hypothetical protein